MAALLLLLAALAACGLAAAPPPPLEVVIYFEALCPDCERFMAGSFQEAWRAVPEILNVTLVPWGFATADWEDGRWHFRCQHGPDECLGNKLHACGVREAAEQAASVDFSVCLEDGEDEARCADDAGLDWERLKDCRDDPDTDEMMLRYRDMTDDARPEIDEVPTVSVDGSRRDQDRMIDDFLRYVCEAWDGEAPPGCLQRLDYERRY